MKFYKKTIENEANRVFKELKRMKVGELQEYWNTVLEMLKKDYQCGSINSFVTNVRNLVKDSKLPVSKKRRLIGGKQKVVVNGVKVDIFTFGVCISDKDSQNGRKTLQDNSIMTNKFNKRIIRNEDAKAAIKYAEEICNNSDNTKELAYALALLTGRRFTEILKTATFTPVDNEKKRRFKILSKKYTTKQLAELDSDYYLAKILGGFDRTLMFDGQLKKKGENTEYLIITLGSKDAIIKGLEKLRTHIDETLTIKETGRKYSRTFGRVAEKKSLELFHIPNMTFHDLRRFYAAAMCRIFPNTPQRELLKTLLGHENTAVSEAYENITIQ